MVRVPSIARLCFLPVAGSVLFGAADASAFCRQTTCDGSGCSVDASGCLADGDPLFYSVPCLSFAIDAGSAEPLGVDDEEMSDIVMEAFQQWRSVDCPRGGHPEFEIQSLGAVESRGIFFCEEATLNVSVWTLEREWGYESSSLGYTTSTFVVDTGEVFDADVELNMLRIQGLVPTDGDVREALLSVATHEAGHFLGLAHSDDSSAVMAASYQNLRPRPLTDDDIEGICALYPPDDARLECSEPGVSEAGLDPEACAMVTGDSTDAGNGLLACSHAPATETPTWLLWLWLSLASTLAARRTRQAQG